jgi:hypothetical protein
VVVMAGAVARADRAPDPHIRICFDRSVQILDEAVERMATAWDQPREPSPRADR